MSLEAIREREVVERRRTMIYALALGVAIVLTITAIILAYI